MGGERDVRCGPGAQRRHRVTALEPHRPERNRHYPPAIAYGEAYVPSSDRHLYAINAAARAIIWMAASTGNGAPSVANHVVYRCNEAFHVLILTARTPRSAQCQLHTDSSIHTNVLSE